MNKAKNNTIDKIIDLSDSEIDSTDLENFTDMRNNIIILQVDDVPIRSCWIERNCRQILFVYDFIILRDTNETVTD